MFAASTMNSFQLVLEGNAGHRARLIDLHTSLSANHSQIGAFLADEVSRTDFLTRFPLYTNNLVRFLEFSAALSSEPGRRTGTQYILREALDLVASILSYSEFDLVDTDSLVKLITGTLKHALPQRPGSLKVVACKLAEKPGLLEHISSSREGCRLIDALFAVHFVKTIPSIHDLWGQKLVALCSTCTGTPPYHGIEAEIKKWQALADVIAALENAERDFQRGALTAMPPQPVTGPLRRLQRDDKKTGIKHTSLQVKPAVEFPTLPDHIVSTIDELRLQTPRSSRAAKVLSEHIQQEELPAIIHTVLASFPCRPCHDLSGDPKALLARTKTLPQSNTGFLNFAKTTPQDTLFGSPIGLWKVLLSAEGLKDIQKQALAGNIGVLEARLRRLASGDWRAGFSKIAGTSDQKKKLEWPLFEAEVGKNIRILWQIDVGLCEGGVYRQHIKLWRVVDTKDIASTIEHVIKVRRSQILQPEDRPDLSKLPAKDTSGVCIPSEWLFVSESSRKQDTSSAANYSCPWVSADDRRELEIYNKFYEFTKPVMDSFLSKSLTAEFPFDMSLEEIEIIRHDQSPTLIMGRSGTGKTTCLVQKLTRNHVASRSIAGQAPIRQILLTRSKFLVEKLRRYTKQLVESQLSKTVSTQVQDPHELTLGEEDFMFSKTLTNLADDEFPFVCTFDQLLKLLENTMEYNDRQKFRGERRSNPLRGNPGVYVRRAQVVDFSLFRSEYWKSFPASLTKFHECELIFAEIMGVIKGSAPIKTDPGHFSTLSRDQYLAFSYKLAPTFSSSQREEVYDLYLLYERQKGKYGDRDAIDRVRALLKLLEPVDADRRSGIQGILDEIYVDEVQDQRSLDIIMLLRLIRDPRGIHLAGDTAQCISKDSTFRFSTTKMIIYDEFSSLAAATHNRNLAVPVVFKLTKNFRSHQGIIGLSSFIMRLMYTGFPQMVDRMEDERSQHSGPIPTLFVGFGASDLGSRFVGLNDVMHSEKVADFGAEQVILVRDDAAKAKVQAELGDQALVLTILDSKGMEFDDVFLVDFFMTSPCANGLRILNTLSLGGGIIETERNPLLCSELKNLYVAVTRARNQLWLFESSANAEPIVELLTENGNSLVEVVRRAGPNWEKKLKAVKPAKSSDPKKYSEVGYQFLQRKQFKEARFCFRKAGDERGQTIAQAHLKMEEGRGHRAHGLTTRFLELFEEAVQLFSDASQPGNAAYCLEEMNHLERAGDIWFEIIQYEKAASLFMQASAWLKASHCYDLIGSYTDAAMALRQGELFDELVRYIVKNRHRLEPEQTAAYSKLCTILLAQGRLSQDLQELVIDALGSDEEKEAFFRKFRLTEQLAVVLVKTRRYGEAFQELMDDGKMAKALSLGLEHIRDDPTIPALDVTMLLRYMEFGDIRNSLCRKPSAEPGQRARYLASTLPSSVSYALWKWTSLSSELQKNTFLDVFSNLGGGLRKDILCITIAAYWPDLGLFCGVNRITDLRPIVQALSRAVDIWSKIRHEDQELPLPIAIALGAFPVKGNTNVWLLDYSPLQDQGKPHCKAVDVNLRSRRLLLDRMTKIFGELDDIGKKLWYPQTNGLCSAFISFGKCDREPPCHRLHIKRESEHCQSRIQELEIMSALACKFQILYYPSRRYSLEDFSQKFYPRKRRWLEYLLEEIIFRSGIEHDCEALIDAITEITTGAEYSSILNGLEDLLFHRLKKVREWHLRNDLSALLEQLQLAELLGRRVADRLAINIRRVMENPWNPSINNTEQHHVYHVIKHLYRACLNAKANDSMSFRENLKHGLFRLHHLEENNFTSFHSIIGMWERLATFLYLMVLPNASVIPLSWAKLHLPVIVTNVNNLKGPQADKDIYGECLIHLLNSFLELLDYLENKPNFCYMYATKRVREASCLGIQERNRNFLAIALINLAATPVPLRGMIPFSSAVQVRFQMRSLHAKEYQGRSSSALPSALFRSFATYQNKDRLVIITTKNTKPVLPNILSQFEGFKVPIITLNSLITPAPQEIAQPIQEADAEHDVVAAAVVRIQVFWRLRRRHLESHRKYLLTRTGKANAFVFDKIVRRNPGQGVLKTYTIVTLGVSVYLDLWMLREEVAAANTLSERVLGNCNMSAAEIEKLVANDLLRDLDEIVKEAAVGRRGGGFRRVEPNEVERLYKDSAVGAEEIKVLLTGALGKVAGMRERLSGVVGRLRGMVD